VYVIAREVAKDEANVSGPFQELLDRVIGPAAVRALEFSVLNKCQRSVRITSKVVRVGNRSDESFNVMNGIHKSPPFAAGSRCLGVSGKRCKNAGPSPRLTKRIPASEIPGDPRLVSRPE
jgi:hypothetical protein